MIRGLYTAASGLISGLRDQERVANNLANANTPGYRAETSATTAFDGVLARQVGNAQSPVPLTFERNLGRVGTGTYQTDRETSFSEGTHRVTEGMLDVAIEGPGFFAINTEEGLRYTRDGHFARSDEGILVTVKNQPVLDTNGQQIEIGGGDVMIRPTGDVLVDGVEVATLRLVELDKATAVRASETEFTPGFGPEPTPSDPVTLGAAIRQGSVESSNVNPASTATDMIAAQRRFSASQSVFSTLEQTLDSAVNTVGRVG